MKTLEQRLAESEKRIAMRIATIGVVEEAAILKHHERDQWQMILPDIGGVGKWRIQVFDPKGFSGHMLFNSKDETVRDAARNGYYLRDDSALDRLQGAPEFIRGNYVLELLAEVNAGKITPFDAALMLNTYDDHRLAA